MVHQGERCPICDSSTVVFIEGSTVPEKFFTREADYHIAAGEEKEWLTVRRCRRCGHGYSPLPIDQDVISRWYAQASADENFLVDTAARRRTAQVVLKRIERLKCTKGRRLLDVGSGPGVFLSEAQSRGWDVAGIEPAAWAVQYAREKLGVKGIQQADMEELSRLAPNSFDVAVAFDVIEHVVSPQELVTAIARVLKPGGCLVLTTPKFDSLTARLMGKRWYCIFPAHVHYFTRLSLTQVLQQAGFEVMATWRHTRYLGWRYLGQRFLALLGQTSGQRVPRSRFALPVNLGDEFEVYARKIS